jgi:hypothetical protein
LEDVEDRFFLLEDFSLRVTLYSAVCRPASYSSTEEEA